MQLQPLSSNKQQETYDRLTTKVRSMDSRASASISDLQRAIGALQAENLHAQMMAMGEGIARRFEAIEQAQQAQSQGGVSSRVRHNDDSGQRPPAAAPQPQQQPTGAAAGFAAQQPSQRV